MRKVPRTVAFRLVLSLTVFMAVMRVLFGTIESMKMERLVLDQLVVGADELTRSITSATWHAMLADDRDQAYQIMSSIGEEHGIDCVRMINKRGEVTFSTCGTGSSPLGISDPLCSPCHGPGPTVVKPDLARRTRVLDRANRSRVLEILTPVLNESACTEAACHAHEPDRAVLGVLAIDLDLADADRELASLREDTFWRTLGEIALMALIIVLLTRWLIGIPLQRLLEGTRAGRRMELDEPVEVAGHGELAVLADSFNAMRVRLRDALQDLRELNEGLEEQVEERSRELNEAQERLIQSDRLASLGQLAASVAHEINNPVSGVLNFSMVVRRMVDDEEKIPENLPRIRRYLDSISEETQRVGHIVSDLLAFSRHPSPESEEVDLGGVVHRVMALLGHKLDLGQIHAEIEIEPGLPGVAGDESQLQQVLVNLVMNAAEAQPEAGRVWVRLRGEDDDVVLEVEDEGTGIDPAHRSRIFDPFFSTKEASRGVGLGLSVVYGIVDAHGGRIEVDSELGRGTIFRVRLPVHVGAHRVGGALGPDGERTP